MMEIIYIYIFVIKKNYISYAFNSLTPIVQKIYWKILEGIGKGNKEKGYYTIFKICSFYKETHSK